ncbi:O-antigen ligase family protein [Sutcliffiella rhizosphaerae]|uniref:O-antigen ligase-related domain-containing protein n=1 Tax=Sutcliffiella rhizosphaerae TaxID=2880967 RepID=A0ABN8AC37_9BACI|nr:O-antigen ligase family protein [Sutcliffiella rhizosphaerae]CAG9621237.1 hypothetical protein BACCIP111883_02009 [Sutcliffiella rhizosphaerae]
MKPFSYLNNSVNSVSILFAISVLSLSYPYGFPLFGLLVLFFGFMKVITGRFRLNLNVGFFFFLLNVVVYLIGMLFNGGIIYKNNISDLTNIFSFFIIWALLSDIQKDQYNLLINKIAKYTAITTFLISIISLHKFYALLGDTKLDRFFFNDYYPPGTSLVRDYNMYSFAMTVGLIMTIYLISKANKLSTMFFYIITFSCIFSSLLFAGSRRGWIVAAIIFVIVIYLLLKFILRFRKNFKKIIKSAIIATISIIFIYFLASITGISFNFQENTSLQQLEYRFSTLKLQNMEESMNPRTDRWDYALNLYNEYNLLEAFVGGGFGYLPKYASIFGTNLQEDYPHNPFLSVMLYSGIIGLLLLLLLFGYTIFSSIKTAEVLSFYFSLLFFLSLIFIVVSSNSIFSTSLFIFIMLIIISIPINKLNTTLSRS